MTAFAAITASLAAGLLLQYGEPAVRALALSVSSVAALLLACLFAIATIAAYNWLETNRLVPVTVSTLQRTRPRGLRVMAGFLVGVALIVAALASFQFADTFHRRTEARAELETMTTQVAAADGVVAQIIPSQPALGECGSNQTLAALDELSSAREVYLVTANTATETAAVLTAGEQASARELVAAAQARVGLCDSYVGSIQQRRAVLDKKLMLFGAITELAAAQDKVSQAIQKGNGAEYSAAIKVDRDVGVRLAKLKASTKGKLSPVEKSVLASIDGLGGISREDSRICSLHKASRCSEANAATDGFNRRWRKWRVDFESAPPTWIATIDAEDSRLLTAWNLEQQAQLETIAVFDARIGDSYPALGTKLPDVSAERWQ